MAAQLNSRGLCALSMRRFPMPYALFEQGEKLSRAFPTEGDVWRHAEEAGLIDVVDGKEVLEDHLVIEPCPADEEILSPDPAWHLPNKIS